MPLYLPMCEASFRLMAFALLKLEVLLLKLLADRQGAVVERQGGRRQRMMPPVVGGLSWRRLLMRSL